MEHSCTRRRLLGAAGKTLLAGVGAAGLLALPGARPSLAFDWKKLLGEKMEGGFGVVKQLRGSATAGGRALKEGDRVESGERVDVAAGSSLILNMSDRSVFRFSGPSSLDLLLSMMRRGLLRLLYGGLLAVVPRDNNYLVVGPAGAVGIKGTVFYREVFPRPGMVGKTMDGTMAVPAGVNDHFCNCFGEVAYLGSDEKSEPFYTDRSTYHHPFFLDPRRENMLVKAPMINHFDDEIERLIGLQQGKKHRADWLKL
ncbi:MAG: hypothetical protein V3S29_11150 [bacterium]